VVLVALGVALWLIIVEDLLEVAAVVLVVSSVGAGTFIGYRRGLVIAPQAPKSMRVGVVALGVVAAVAMSAYVLTQLD
jgi:hypothetical protein